MTHHPAPQCLASRVPRRIIMPTVEEIQGPFDSTVTFMRVPLSRDLTRSKAAILGIPFDMGTHPVRIGSRQGPAAIREQSYLVRPYEPPDFASHPPPHLTA